MALAAAAAGVVLVARPPRRRTGQGSHFDSSHPCRIVTQNFFMLTPRAVASYASSWGEASAFRQPSPLSTSIGCSLPAGLTSSWASLIQAACPQTRVRLSLTKGVDSASEFLAAYLIEYALARGRWEP